MSLVRIGGDRFFTSWGVATGLVAVSVILAIALVWTRFAPESSPIARGAAHAAKHRCSDPGCTRETQNSESACKDIEGQTSCDDVVAYWRAMRLKRDFTQRLRVAPNNRLLAGERLARKHNCFQCHGELGQGGLANARAFKNYVPGYFGDDFRTLTDGGRKEVVREWIETGSSVGLTEPPLTGWVARWFLQRQAISMPKFPGLPAEEIDLLVDYVVALNRYGPLDSQGLTRYAQATAVSTAVAFDRELQAIGSTNNLNPFLGRVMGSGSN